MRMRLARNSLFFLLAACGTAANTSSGSGNASSRVQVQDPASPEGRPFASTPVATFNPPWAMAFLPGTNSAIVTEKRGHIWLVDIRSGTKQAVSGAPRVLVSDQGGLLDVALSPTFTADKLVYLSYAEPSPNGGSGLALARAKLVRSPSGSTLQGLTVLWHDPAGGEGGQARAARLRPARDAVQEDPAPAQPGGLHFRCHGCAGRIEPRRQHQRRPLRQRADLHQLSRVRLWSRRSRRCSADANSGGATLHQRNDPVGLHVLRRNRARAQPHRDDRVDGRRKGPRIAPGPIQSGYVCDAIAA